MEDIFLYHVFVFMPFSSHFTLTVCSLELQETDLEEQHTGNPLQHVESLHADRERTGLLEVCRCLCGVFCANQQGVSVLRLSSCWVCAQLIPLKTN